MYLATTDITTAKANPRVFAARHEITASYEDDVRIKHANVADVLKARAPGIGHHHDPAGLLERPITLKPKEAKMVNLLLKVVPPMIVIVNAIIDYLNRR